MGAGRAVGRMPHTHVERFCNVALSPADHQLLGLGDSVPCARSNELSQGHSGCWQCDGVAKHQGSQGPAGSEGTSHLPEGVIWCRYDSGCNCILQLQDNSQFWAFLNLSKANFYLCMHETIRKGICSFRQKFIFYLSQRTG